MTDRGRTTDQLLQENEELRARVAALEGVDLERRCEQEELAKSKAFHSQQAERGHIGDRGSANRRAGSRRVE